MKYIDINEMISLLEEVKYNISWRYGSPKNNIDTEILEQIEKMLNKLKEKKGKGKWIYNK